MTFYNAVGRSLLEDKPHDSEMCRVINFYHIHSQLLMNSNNFSMFKEVVGMVCFTGRQI